ncbi:hypothetical protein pb186bvf_014975 [Paramecium bursaria]
MLNIPQFKHQKVCSIKQDLSELLFQQLKPQTTLLKVNQKQIDFFKFQIMWRYDFFAQILKVRLFYCPLRGRTALMLIKIINSWLLNEQ